MLFCEAVKKFLLYLQAIKNASEHTLRNYRIDLEAFNAFTQREELFIDAVDKGMIRAYLAAMAQRLSKRRTILRRLSSLRSLFRHPCGKNG